MTLRVTVDDRGFTIIESLVAFAILALMLVSLFGASGTALTSVARAEDMDRAVLLARSKLDEITATHTVLPQKGGGEFAGTPIHWTIESKNLTAQASGVNVQDVHLVLRWSNDGIEKSLAVDTRHIGWAAQ